MSCTVRAWRWAIVAVSSADLAALRSAGATRRGSAGDLLLADGAVVADVQGLGEAGRGVRALGCVERVAGDRER